MIGQGTIRKKYIFYFRGSQGAGWWATMVLEVIRRKIFLFLGEQLFCKRPMVQHTKRRTKFAPPRGEKELTADRTK